MRMILKSKIITQIGISENKLNANWKDRNERLKPMIMKLSKAIPLQAWTDPEGSRRLRIPDFKTIGTRRW